MNVFSFDLSHIAEKLQNNISQKYTCNAVIGTASVKQRHIKHVHMHVHFFRENAPLIKYFVVISSQPINTFYNENIVFSQKPNKSLITRSIKILSCCFIGIYAVYLDRKSQERVELPVKILIFG